jgi:hypothetical protein
MSELFKQEENENSNEPFLTLMRCVVVIFSAPSEKRVSVISLCRVMKNGFCLYRARNPLLSLHPSCGLASTVARHTCEVVETHLVALLHVYHKLSCSFGKPYFSLIFSPLNTIKMRGSRSTVLTAASVVNDVSNPTFSLNGNA